MSVFVIIFISLRISNINNLNVTDITRNINIISLINNI